MEPEPQVNRETDADQAESSASIFGKAAASIEKAAAARRAEAVDRNISGDSREFSQTVMHRAELVEPDSALPVPAGPLQRPDQKVGRTSLWKRIKMKAWASEDASAGAELTAKMKAFEGRLDEFDDRTGERFDELSRRLDEVWEAEEQLSLLVDIQDKMDRISRTQGEIGDAVGALTRKVALLTRCVFAALAAALTGLGVYFSL